MIGVTTRWVLLAASAWLAVGGPAAWADPIGTQPPLLVLPPVGLRSSDIALVINDADPASVETGTYYASRRAIPPERIIHVHFVAGQGVMSRSDFERVSKTVEAQAGHDVQGLALAWTLPFRVECMSVTSAFAFGFDTAHCAEGCRPTKPSPYFASTSRAPWSDLRIRPAMLLAGPDVASVRRMIDRGVSSDERWPNGTAYLVSTSDAKRNVRSEAYDHVRRVLGSAYPIAIVPGDTLDARLDVMFYFTGVARVARLDSNRFVNGALADHLTSLGGVLTGASQTTALEWIAAGATGTYGATTEPCNFRAKFPEVALVMGHYLAGESLLEAYWKSVQMPGQGVFVGDPMARPFGGVRVSRSGIDVVYETRGLVPGRYQLQATSGLVESFQRVSEIIVAAYGPQRISLPMSDRRRFRLIAMP